MEQEFYMARLDLVEDSTQNKLMFVSTLINEKNNDNCVL